VDNLIHQGNLDGQRDYPLTIAQVGAIDLIGVRFRVGGLATFLRIPLYELSNQVVDLQNGLGVDACTLEAQLYDFRADFDLQGSLLDRFFLNRLQHPPALEITVRLAERIADSRQALSIREVSRESGYSIRSVDRLFRHYLGITPKFYAQILRFQRALETLQSAMDMPLTEIALGHGYYDQAHFTRSIERFSGRTPQQLRQEAAHYNPQRVHFLQDE
jgi:AraC-like DNA-binding protein